MSDRNNGNRPLEHLGISEREEQVYRWLLKHRNMTAAEVARGLSLAAMMAQRLLDALEAKGLATHTPSRPRSYLPVSPDVALGGLVAKLEKGLKKTQTVIDELQEEAKVEQSDAPEQILELITSPEAERQAYDQISRLARHEVLHLSKPPLLVTRLDLSVDEDVSDQYQARERGVRYRSVADTDFVTLPGVMKRIREEMASGEEVRVYPDLPFKMVVCDREMALIPLQLESATGPCLLVKSSALLDALCLLFELIWRQSSPLQLSGPQDLTIKEEDTPVAEQMRELISLLAAGMNDKSIYMELDISRRTHQTRISELMQTLSAKTRFQAGWRAARLFPDSDE